MVARRLIDSGVRYMHVNYDSGQPRDDHGEVATNLERRVPDMDRASAALIRDLKRRGLLDQTPVVWIGLRLHQLGIDHTQLTYRYAGRNFR